MKTTNTGKTSGMVKRKNEWYGENTNHRKQNIFSCLCWRKRVACAFLLNSSPILHTNFTHHSAGARVSRVL